MLFLFSTASFKGLLSVFELHQTRMVNHNNSLSQIILTRPLAKIAVIIIVTMLYEGAGTCKAVAETAV